jgi:signal transduction histidine kinase
MVNQLVSRMITLLASWLDAIDRVWEAGYTTGQENTGLGLNFIREVIDNHQGEITIESTVNVGTRVIISLPQATNGSRSELPVK